MVIANKPRFFTVLFGIICLIVIISSYFKSPQNTTSIKTDNSSIFQKQTSILNQIKLEVTPSITDNKTTFYIDLETFEHPNLLTIDLIQSSLLVINNEDPILPIKWIPLEKNNYSIKGHLEFNYKPLDNATIEFILFCFEERSFKWKY
ncbi:hypothetical protein DID75_04545 [Candidatus Marinamargulisbacteria bacterium SCGC AG-410-N11]|nr:hypothetical protein DID75_04545 [Candidatus Marinamargulisbacteria bacterium SCGC AG-410-N11]